MTKMFRDALLRIAVSGGAVLLIGYVLRDKLGEAFVILRSDVNWSYFFVALAFYVGVQFTMAYRLYRLFDIKKIVITYPQTAYLCIVGLFFNLFLPSSVGGDVAKIYYASKHSGKKIESATSIVIDRLIGFLTVMLIAVGGLLFVGKELDDPRITYAVGFFVVFVGGVLVFFMSRRFARFFGVFRVLIPSPKLKDKLSELYHAIYDCKNSWKTLLFALGVSIAGQTMLVLMNYYIGHGLGVSLDIGHFFLLVPLITVVSMAPSIGGLGVREAGAIWLFSFYMEPERALALSLLVDLIVYGFGLFSGAIYALNGGLKAQTIHIMEEEVEEIA